MKSKAKVILVIILLLGGLLVWGQRSANAPGFLQLGKEDDSVDTHQTEAPTFNKRLYSVGEAGSLWWVVNKDRALDPLRYEPSDLQAVGSGQYLRAAAAQAYLAMSGAAEQAGYSLIAESGYRSYDTQVSVYNSEVANFGQAQADTESARPGHSEHQTGWAIDIGTPGCYEDCFGQTAAAGWLADNAFSHGFILRYPKGKDSVTGYRYEPWHFRYVGQELAAELHDQGNPTLEEFFGL